MSTDTIGTLLERLARTHCLSARLADKPESARVDTERERTLRECAWGVFNGSVQPDRVRTVLSDIGTPDALMVRDAVDALRLFVVLTDRAIRVVDGRNAHLTAHGEMRGFRRE